MLKKIQKVVPLAAGDGLVFLTNTTHKPYSKVTEAYSRNINLHIPFHTRHHVEGCQGGLIVWLQDTIYKKASLHSIIKCQGLVWLQEDTLQAEDTSAKGILWLREEQHPQDMSVRMTPMSPTLVSSHKHPSDTSQNTFP